MHRKSMNGICTCGNTKFALDAERFNEEIRASALEFNITETLMRTRVYTMTEKLAVMTAGGFINKD